MHHSHPCLPFVLSLFTLGAASRRSGGGEPGRYLLALHRLVGTDHRLLAAVYEGLAAGGFASRATGCGGVQTNGTGSGAIGTAITLVVNNATGVPGLALGMPISVPIGPCPGCTLGTTLDFTWTGASLGFVIPNNVSLVGATISAQGFDLVPVGPCLGQIRIGNTIDLTIR